MDYKFIEKEKFKEKTKLGLKIELPFVCSVCGDLTIVHNPHFYYRDYSTTIRKCNTCLFAFY